MSSTSEIVAKMRLSLAEKSQAPARVSEHSRPLTKVSQQILSLAKVAERKSPVTNNAKEGIKLAKILEPQQKATRLFAEKVTPKDFLEQIKALPSIPQITRGDESDHLRTGVIAYDSQQYVKALGAWKKAAAEGDVEAQYRIGVLYSRGEGVIQNIADAVVWYERAAKTAH